ncbi:uncharacterized protein LOC141820088 [Curcuma longa]|uniref:uncharacterized protein LOC141820088 n=1 Tax=Curcuma longa TaxID=136217 RepID=UPI003D9E73C4
MRDLGAVAGKPPGAGERTMVRLRHRILLQDHEDLVKETEGKRKKLQMANQKKFKLIAEVKFLHKRYKSLLQNPYRTIQVNLKKKPQSRIFIGQRSRNVSSQLPANNQGCKLRDAATPTTAAVIDLNEASSPISWDMDDYQFIAESDKFRKSSMKGDPVDHKLSV